MNQSLQTINQPENFLVQSGGETASQAVASQAKALVEARYIMAYRNPRDIDRVREKLMKECKRPSFARVARYFKPIGKGVEGPSIRFAEAALRCMGNITIETMTVYDDREKRIVRVAVTDLEANVPYSQDVTIDKAVERKNPKPGDVVIRTRLNSRNESVSLIEATEDDILNKQNALISKAVRTLGLRLVPGDLIDEAMYFVKKTLNDESAKDPDAAKLSLFDAFGDIGITVEQIKEFIGHDCASLTPKELNDLRGLYSAIRDGEATWAEAVEKKKPKTAEPASSDISDMEKKLRGQVKSAIKPIDPSNSDAGGKVASKTSVKAEKSAPEKEPEESETPATNNEDMFGVE